MSSMQKRLLCLSAALITVSIPFFAVEFVPSTDIYQHVSQIEYLFNGAEGSSGSLNLQYITPYWLGYWLIGGLWLVFDPILVPKMSLLVAGWLWVLAVFALAEEFEGSATMAVLAALLFFNHTFVWGFYTFIVGFPVFAAWVILLSRVRRYSTILQVAAILAGSVVLYFAHILWFLAGVCWFALYKLIIVDEGLDKVARESCAFLPAVILGAVWYPRLAAGGFESGTHWFVLPTERMSLDWIVRGAFGMFRGPVGFAVFAGIVCLSSLIFYKLWHRNESRRIGSKNKDFSLVMLTGCLFFLSLALFLPNNHQNTISLAFRWLPAAGVFGLIAFPRLKNEKIRVVALVFVLAVSGVYAAKWHSFEKLELTGLKSSIEKIPVDSDVIGLDYRKHSAVIRGRPFIQTFALAQVVSSADLNFSFAEFAPFPVQLERKKRWTRGLEWFPEKVNSKDLEHFEFAVVNASRKRHSKFVENYSVQAVTNDGFWRLYRLGDR